MIHKEVVVEFSDQAKNTLCKVKVTYSGEVDSPTETFLNDACLTEATELHKKGSQYADLRSSKK
jgi:hypothetical protein